MTTVVSGSPRLADDAPPSPSPNPAGAAAARPASPPRSAPVDRADRRRDVDQPRRPRGLARADAPGTTTRPGVARRVVARAAGAGCRARRTSPNARRAQPTQRRRRALAPAHDEVGQAVGVRARVELGGAVDRRHGRRAVGVGEGRAGPAAISSSSALGLAGVDDPVALAAAQVEADVALVVGGMGEGARRRPVDAAQLEPRGELERQRGRAARRRRAPAARRASRRAGARSRRPPSPSSSGPPASTAREHLRQQVGAARVDVHADRRGDDHVGAGGQRARARAPNAVVDRGVDVVERAPEQPARAGRRRASSCERSQN